MPIFVLFVGIILIAAGINNKIPVLTALVKEDFRPTDGATPFHIWMFAIIGVGSLGYIQSLKGLANGFLTLIIIGLLLSNTGFVTKFTQAIEG